MQTHLLPGKPILPGSKSGCNPGKMGLPGLQPDLHARQNGCAGIASRFTRPAKWVCRGCNPEGGSTVIVLSVGHYFRPSGRPLLNPFFRFCVRPGRNYFLRKNVKRKQAFNNGWLSVRLRGKCERRRRRPGSWRGRSDLEVRTRQIHILVLLLSE